MDTLSISDLVTTVSSKIPVNSTTAYVEASEVKKLIIGSVSCVSNLSGMVFINSTGATAKVLTSLLNKDRPKDLAYTRLACNIDASVIDNRIKQDPLYLSVCLKLLQSSFDSSIEVVTLIDTPKMKSPSKMANPMATPGVFLI